jgi:hypothetical protein
VRTHLDTEHIAHIQEGPRPCAARWWFTERFETRDLKDAQVLLEEFGASR